MSNAHLLTEVTAEWSFFVAREHTGNIIIIIIIIMALVSQYLQYFQAEFSLESSLQTDCHSLGRTVKRTFPLSSRNVSRAGAPVRSRKHQIYRRLKTRPQRRTLSLSTVRPHIFTKHKEQKRAP